MWFSPWLRAASYAAAPSLSWRVTIGVVYALMLTLGAAAGADLESEFRRDVAPLLEAHCARCHAGPDAEGEFEISGFLDGSRALGERPMWRAVREQLSSGAMPPKRELRPERARVDAALAWIERWLAAQPASADPGRPTLRRLNRREYENSVRDLLGVHFDAAAVFPPDESGYGFDNIGDVLSISDTLFEKYVRAAEVIAARAVDVPDPDHPPTTRIDDVRLVHTEKFATHGGAWSLFTNGFIGVDYDFPRAGSYVLRARAFGQQAGPDPVRMRFRLATRDVARFDVLALEGAPETYEQQLEIDAGVQRFEAWFVNDYWNPDEPDKHKRDRNLRIEYLEIAGPVGAVMPSEFQRRALPAGDEIDAREVVEDLAERAWRRPVSRADVDRLCALSAAGASRDEVVRDAIVGVLSSPRFLFRLETDPPGLPTGSVRSLDAFELAARLSYFLWSSLPDDELFECARAGRLERELEAQVRRMLKDARASELTQNFAAQWLQLRTLERVAPDARRFPDFDVELTRAMREESELFFECVLRESRPISELVDPDFTFLNERLAQHYGIEGVRGAQMRRVALDAAQREVRGGLLQHASILTLTSNPTRTSLVKRGKWVLETLLASPPLAPQPGVDSLDDSREVARTASLRERLELHRADAKCAVCHERLDPLGFALENFDPIGRWRSEADGFAVDASGEFEDGTAFVGSTALERRVARDPRFLRAVLEKLAVYALGRGLREVDAPWIEALSAARRGQDPSLPQLIQDIVASPPFRTTVVARTP
jgi:hypothetical protein